MVRVSRGAVFGQDLLGSLALVSVLVCSGCHGASERALGGTLRVSGGVTARRRSGATVLIPTRRYRRRSRTARTRPGTPALPGIQQYVIANGV